jgi:hypothetical protein
MMPEIVTQDMVPATPDTGTGVRGRRTAGLQGAGCGVLATRFALRAAGCADLA